jgi:hypothetical protein
MRLAGVILLVLAIVLGTVAVRSYLEDSRKRDNALGQLLVVPVHSPLKSSLVGEVANYDSKLRNDEVLGLIAAILLINSLSMLSRPRDVNRHRHGPLA